MVGKQVEAYPDIAKRIVDEGHDVQNHTYNHRALGYLSDREVLMEVFKTSVAIREITGRRATLLRPPGGNEGYRLSNLLNKYGISTALWTVNCATVEGTTKQKITNYVVSSAKPGAILLIHNLEIVTLNALPDIIDSLKHKGYEFVTMSE